MEANMKYVRKNQLKHVFFQKFMFINKTCLHNLVTELLHRSTVNLDSS